MEDQPLSFHHVQSDNANEMQHLVGPGPIATEVDAHVSPEKEELSDVHEHTVIDTSILGIHQFSVQLPQILQEGRVRQRALLVGFG